MRCSHIIIIEWEEHNTVLFNVSVLDFAMNMSKSSGRKDFVWAIELNYLGLELIGLWPENDGIFKRSLCSNIRAVFAFIMLIVLIVPLVHALTRVWGDMALVIDNLRVTLPIFSILLKFVTLLWKQSVLLSVINTIREDWTMLKLNAEREVMLKRVRIIRLIIICIYVLSIVAIFVVSILPYFGLSFRHVTNLTDRNKLLPLQTYYLYNTDKSPVFELTYLTQVIAMLVAVTIYTSIDTFFVFAIFHVCGQLENLRHRLGNLITTKEFNKILCYHVMTHLRHIRCANNIEDIFTLMVLGSIIYFAIILCLLIFVLLVAIESNLKMDTESLIQIFYMIVAIIIFIMQTFFYCYAGELITEQSEAIYRAVCDLQWYKLETKKARSLIILMIRSQELIHLTAGKIIPLTMTTFCNILKTSAGYIPFLLAIQD